MSLLDDAARAYAQGGDDGLRRWEESLSFEQRLALIHDFDQFGRAMQDVADAMAPLAQHLNAVALAVSRSVDEVRRVSGTVSGSNDPDEAPDRAQEG